jgi:hypothetical protein
MRRRRFLAGVGTLAALAGCLGGESRSGSDDDGTGENSPAENDWEPAPGPTGSTNATTRKGDETGNVDGPNEGTRTGSENGTSNGDDSATFAKGETWRADRAQVAADSQRAGAAAEFELETAPPRSCGRTCRKLRAALTNTGSEEAENVVVRTELESGGTILRERRDAIGDLPAGATHRADERVELGTFEALRVQRNGAITVTQVVVSAERREVFEKRIEL